MLFPIAVLLIAGHGILFYFVSSHATLSAAMAAGVIILIAAKHLGLLAPLYGLFRRRSELRDAKRKSPPLV